MPSASQACQWTLWPRSASAAESKASSVRAGSMCCAVTSAMRMRRASAAAGQAAGGAGLHAIAVAYPPVEAADELLHLEAEPRQLERRLGGAVAADAVAVGDDELALGQALDRLGGHLPVGEADGAGDVAVGIGL